MGISHGLLKLVLICISFGWSIIKTPPLPDVVALCMLVGMGFVLEMADEIINEVVSNRAVTAVHVMVYMFILLMNVIIGVAILMNLR